LEIRLGDASPSRKTKRPMLGKKKADFLMVWQQKKNRASGKKREEEPSAVAPQRVSVKGLPAEPSRGLGGEHNGPGPGLTAP